MRGLNFRFFFTLLDIIHTQLKKSVSNANTFKQTQVCLYSNLNDY